MSGRHFFVQETRKEPWHCETDLDCEVMLCGKRISVDASYSKVQARWGPRRCADCWMELERLHKIEAFVR